MKFTSLIFISLIFLSACGTTTEIKTSPIEQQIYNSGNHYQFLSSGLKQSNDDIVKGQQLVTKGQKKIETGKKFAKKAENLFDDGEKNIKKGQDLIKNAEKEKKDIIQAYQIDINQNKGE
jgi:hypothetical protein